MNKVRETVNNAANVANVANAREKFRGGVGKENLKKFTDPQKLKSANTISNVVMVLGILLAVLFVTLELVTLAGVFCLFLLSFIAFVAGWQIGVAVVGFFVLLLVALCLVFCCTKVALALFIFVVLFVANQIKKAGLRRGDVQVDGVPGPSGLGAPEESKYDYPGAADDWDAPAITGFSAQQ